MIRVVVADDNPVLRLGIASHLALCDDIEVVGEAADGEEALAQVQEHQPDVLLLDVRMPKLDGLGVLERLQVPVATLMLTNSDDPAVIQESLRLGATGYLVYPHADAPDIDQAVRQVARGQTVLGSEAARQLVSLLPPSGPDASTTDLTGGMAQRYGLSDREIEVLDLVSRGCSNHDIAGQLFISEKTVKNHLNRIFAKLHATNRGEAVAIWRGDKEPT